MQSRNLQSVGLALVSLIAGVLIGLVGGQVFNISDETVTDVDEQPPTSQTAVADFRAKFNVSASQYTELTYNAMVDEYDDAPDSRLAAERAEAASEDLLDIFKVVYSDEELEDFSDALAAFNSSLDMYVLASKDESASGIAEAESEISEATSALGASLESLTEEELSADDLTDRFNDYTDGLTRAFNAAVAGNYDESYGHLDESRRNSLDISDDLAEAVIIANKDEF